MRLPAEAASTAEGDFTGAADSMEADSAAEDFAVAAGASGFMGRTVTTFGYDDYYDGDEVSCYPVRQRIHTRRGWRTRWVQVCD